MLITADEMSPSRRERERERERERFVIFQTDFNVEMNSGTF